MTRSARSILVVVTVALLLAAIGTVALGLWAKGLADAATKGKSQAEAGAKSLAAQDATAAGPRFTSATQTFAAAKRSLGPDWVAAVVRPIPWVGRQYSAAQTLVEIGLDGSNAGTQLTQALLRASAVSSSSGSPSRFASVLANGHRNIEAALAALADASERAGTLPTEGLVPPLAKAAISVKAALSRGAPFLNRSRGLLQLESYLFSADRRLLVVSQDGAELRPTGGFAGSFGIIDVGPTGMRLESYKDVYTLPDPPGRVAPPAGAYMTSDFSFRDANWWIDFPTSAKAMLGFWHTYRQPPVDGIVAIDTVAMRDLLGVLGPIHVPSYGETFSSANLLERLLPLVELGSRDAPASKGVLIALANELEKRVLESSPSDTWRSAAVLGKAADEKHVQVYLVDSRAQATVERLGWSGRVTMPHGTTDLLAVSNAMNRGSKVNIALTKTIHYEVGLQADRSAETTLVLGYANVGAYPLPKRSAFRDWLRVYRAPDTVFASATPSGGITTTTVEFGLPAEVRTFELQRGESHSETLVARVPAAMNAEADPAGGKVLHYRLHMVRQDDLEDIPTDVVVTSPGGWSVSAASAKLTASGAALPVTPSGDGAHMAVPLTGDFDLDVWVASP